MPVHPAAPSDVPGLTEAYLAVSGSFVDVCEGVREAEWELPTSCPGWAVRDHLAHVLHIADVLSGSQHPGGSGVAEEVQIGSPGHVRNPVGVWTEQGVRARRGQDPRAMIDELRGVVQVRAAGMYDPELTMETPVTGMMGRTVPFGPATLLRLGDIWEHEQDIREAVGRPGSLDTPGASAMVSIVEDNLPGIVEDVAPEPGTTVIIECTGPLTARMGARTGTGEDGAVVARPLFTGHEDEDGSGHVAGPSTTIRMSTDALTRRAAGRRSTEDTAWTAEGDQELARRVVEALVITP